MAKSKKGGEQCVFAFVEMDSAEEARKMIEVFDGKEVFDSVVEIKQVNSDPTIPKNKNAAMPSRMAAKVPISNEKRPLKVFYSIPSINRRLIRAITSGR